MEENKIETTSEPEENRSVVENTEKQTDISIAETEIQPEVKAQDTSMEGILTEQTSEKIEEPVQTPPVSAEPSVTPMAPIPPFVARASTETSMQTSQNGNISQNQMGDGMRRLKKIKRPVKRLPQGNPIPPSSQMINLDELLDSQMNLPTATNASSDNTSFHQENENRQMPSHAAEKPHVKPRFISESDLDKAPRFIDQLMIDNLFTYKGVGVIAGVVFILTLIIGMMLFGGETVVKDGLQGVIVNTEVPRGRARCGVAERTQGCVLYIMNPQRQDLQGRDFYDLASQLTGRQRFVIETGNMRYSNIKVRAGEIAQINIPPLQ